MTDKPFKIEKSVHTGKYTFMHPTGVYSNTSSDELLEILIKFLNDYYESREKVEEEYLDFSLTVERVLQEDYNGSNIPMWSHDHTKKIADKLGISVKKELL